MASSQVPVSKILLWTLVFGVMFNLLGWLGNNLLLGDDWDLANAGVEMGYNPPWSPLVKEIITVVSDFVFAFSIISLFAIAGKRTVGTALKLAGLVWVVGVAILYLVLVNSGFLPIDIAWKTSLLALAIFVLGAPILPLVIKG